MKIWALVTGAIRNEFYLRTLLFHLLDYRNKGYIEGIVISTWKGETEKINGLRGDLSDAGIILVETETLNEEAEKHFNQIGYARQQMTLQQGLKILPENSFVLKLRTDFVQGIKTTLKLIKQNVDFSIKKIGNFPSIYEYRLTQQYFNAKQLFFYNDRFFIGYKDDLLKICIPSQNFKATKYDRFIENDLLGDYLLQQYPFIRKMWDLLPVSFYDEFFEYCKNTKEEIVVPRIICRAYAHIVSYAYTHILFADSYGINKDNDPVDILCLFRNCIKANDIEKIIMGNVLPSRNAKIFQEEMIKVILYTEEAKSYTKEEYDELQYFIEIKMKKSKMLATYPFIIVEQKGYLYQKEKVVQGFSQDTVNMLDISVKGEFNGISSSIFQNMNEKTIDIDVIKGAILDRDSKAICLYLKLLEQHSECYDQNIISNCCRNIRLNFMYGMPSAYTLLSLYLCIKNQGYFGKTKDGRIKYQDMICKVISNNRQGVEFEKEDFLSAEQMFNKVLYTAETIYTKENISATEIEVLKSVLLIFDYEQDNHEETIIKMVKVKSDIFQFELLRYMYDHNMLFLLNNYRADNEKLFFVNQFFSILSDDRDLSFGCIKGYEIWITYNKFDGGNQCEIVRNANGKPWPFGESNLSSCYAMHMCHKGTSIVISIELGSNNESERTMWLNVLHKNQILSARVDQIGVIRIKYICIEIEEGKTEYMRIIQDAFNEFKHIGDLLSVES